MAQANKEEDCSSGYKYLSSPLYRGITAKSFQVTGILTSLESDGAPDEESSESESEEDPFIDPFSDMEEIELERRGS